MIKNLLFDFGGVVVTLDHPNAVRRFVEMGLKEAPKLLDPYTQTSFFADLELGRIGKEKFRACLSEAIGREVSMEECAYGLMGFVTDVPRENISALKRLRSQGYKLILLSNTNPFIADWALSPRFFEEGLPVSSYFDACYLSYECHVMKPAPAFFEKVIDGEGIQADETLFLDDGPSNVAAAQKMGFHVYCPSDSTVWTREIDRYLASS